MEEHKLTELMHSVFGSTSGMDPSHFFSDPEPFDNLEQVASGLPAAPWAVYEKKSSKNGDPAYLLVKYDPLLRCVTTCHVKSYPGKGSLHDSKMEKVIWNKKPKYHVAKETYAMYDRSVNRSRVITRANWIFVASAIFALVHMVWMVRCLLVEHSSLVATGLVAFDVVSGLILRCISALVARFWNYGSRLQVFVAFASPTFWSMAYAGHKADERRWIWRLPLLFRVLSGLVCLFLNSVQAATNHEVMDVVLLIVGLVFGANASLDLRVLGHMGLQSRAVNVEVDFLFMASCNHFYTLITHMKLLGRGEMEGALVAIGIFAAMEAVSLLRVAWALDEVMVNDTVKGRMQTLGKKALLAGSSMVCDMRKGTSETYGEESCTRTYVTWVVRGKLPGATWAKGAWNSMAILLPGPWGGDCEIVGEDVAHVATDDDEKPVEVCTVLSLRGRDPEMGPEAYGNTSVVLEPLLREIFHEADKFKLETPNTLYEKNGVGFLRAVGAGVVGIPIF